MNGTNAKFRKLFVKRIFRALKKHQIFKVDIGNLKL